MKSNFLKITFWPWVSPWSPEFPLSNGTIWVRNTRFPVNRNTAVAEKLRRFAKIAHFSPSTAVKTAIFTIFLHGKQRNCMENCQIACSTSSNSSKSLLCFDFHEHSKNPGTFIFQTLMFTQGVYLNFLDSESTASQSSYLIWTSSSYVGDDQVGSIKFLA